MAADRTFVPQLEDPVDHRSSNIPHASQAWHSACMAVLFEASRSQVQMNVRIKPAMRLILLRERELFANSFNVAERSALNNSGLRALLVLLPCLGLSKG